jgi:SAM-dependent methyltransferase
LPDPYARLAGVYDELVVDPCHSGWADFLAARWQDDDIHAVLDVCCGSGLMTTELIARGYEAVGVDASAAMLDLARARLGPEVRLLEAVLPDLPVDGPFDAAVSTLDGLNYLTPAALEATFARLHDVVRPGGWLVFDVHAEAAFVMMQANPSITGADGRRTWMLTSDCDAATRRVSTVIELHAPDDDFREEHVQYVHAEADIRRWLEHAGFVDIETCDEYSDAPVRDTTLRTTWLARRGSE